MASVNKWDTSKTRALQTNPNCSVHTAGKEDPIIQINFVLYLKRIKRKRTKLKKAMINPKIKRNLKSVPLRRQKKMSKKTRRMRMTPTLPLCSSVDFNGGQMTLLTRIGSSTLQNPKYSFLIQI